MRTVVLSPVSAMSASDVRSSTASALTPPVGQLALGGVERGPALADAGDPAAEC